MTTVGEAVATVEQRLIVARDREFELFHDWLFNDQPAAELLNVSGPPGVGKTTLVQAFAREAHALGWTVAVADGHRIGASERDLIQTLNDGRRGDTEGLVSRLNGTRSLVVIDTFEELEALTTYLQQELLPRLDMKTKVVIAGRRPLVLAWSRADGWPKIVRLLALEGFSLRDSRSYLAQRGIARRELVNPVVAATAGNPLALSVAADLISQFGVRDFAAEARWHIAGRSLLRRLLSETAGDTGLGVAVEACSVVRIFDEATLHALTLQEDVSTVFDRLCRLSVIKADSNGLMLHDNVRAIVSNDLRWRRPSHHQLLRQRALKHFKERLRSSSQSQRGWLISECFHLWENPIIKELFFGSEGASSLTIEPALDINQDAVLELHAQDVQDASQFGADAQLLSEALKYPHTRVRVAKNVDGASIGLSMVMPICHESIAILQRHPLHADFVNAYFALTRRKPLPSSPHYANTHYLFPVVAASEPKSAVRCALLRELAAVFGTSGRYLCASREPVMDRLLTECGFEMLTESQKNGSLVRGWVLDLSRIGFEGWIETVIDGRQVQMPPSNGDLEVEILSALTHWDDAVWLAGNCRLIASGAGREQRAAATREAIKAAFSSARAEGPGAIDKALRALELAYMKRSASHKQAMRSLSVSRATFCRLCHRGVGILAEHIGGQNPRPESL
jgi:DNA polymerase III delta prime subunit